MDFSFRKLQSSSVPAVPTVLQYSPLHILTESLRYFLGPSSLKYPEPYFFPLFETRHYSNLHIVFSTLLLNSLNSVLSSLRISHVPKREKHRGSGLLPCASLHSGNLSTGVLAASMTLYPSFACPASHGCKSFAGSSVF